MQRRDFAKTGIVGIVAAAAIPATVRAAEADPYKNVVFTEADPGHWEKAKALHVPETTVAGDKLTIKTPHPMTEAHYIVSHTVVLGDGTFLGRKTFSYKDEPVSEHVLPAGYRAK